MGETPRCCTPLSFIRKTQNSCTGTVTLTINSVRYEITRTITYTNSKRNTVENCLEIKEFNGNTFKIRTNKLKSTQAKYPDLRVCEGDANTIIVQKYEDLSTFISENIITYDDIYDTLFISQERFGSFLKQKNKWTKLFELANLSFLDILTTKSATELINMKKKNTDLIKNPAFQSIFGRDKSIFSEDIVTLADATHNKHKSSLQTITDKYASTKAILEAKKCDQIKIQEQLRHLTITPLKSNTSIVQKIENIKQFLNDNQNVEQNIKDIDGKIESLIFQLQKYDIDSLNKKIDALVKQKKPTDGVDYDINTLQHTLSTHMEDLNRLNQQINDINSFVSGHKALLDRHEASIYQSLLQSTKFSKRAKKYIETLIPKVEVVNVPLPLDIIIYNKTLLDITKTQRLIQSYQNHQHNLLIDVQIRDLCENVAQGTMINLELQSNQTKRNQLLVLQQTIKYKTSKLAYLVGKLGIHQENEQKHHLHKQLTALESASTKKIQGLQTTLNELHVQKQGALKVLHMFEANYKSIELDLQACGSRQSDIYYYELISEALNNGTFGINIMKNTIIPNLNARANEMCSIIGCDKLEMVVDELHCVQRKHEIRIATSKCRDIANAGGYMFAIYDAILKITLGALHPYITEFIIVDEIFDGCSEQNFDISLKLINSFRQRYRKILLISHNINVIKMFDKRIRIRVDDVEGNKVIE